MRLAFGWHDDAGGDWFTVLIGAEFGDLEPAGDDVAFGAVLHPLDLADDVVGGLVARNGKSARQRRPSKRCGRAGGCRPPRNDG